MDINKSFRIISVLLAQGVLIYGHFLGHNPLTYSAFTAALAAFLVLSFFASKHAARDKKAQAVAAIATRNAERLSGKWVNFTDGGGEFADPRHPYSGDLSLFGEDSLFLYLNDTNTAYGKDILRMLFLTEKRGADAVGRRQAAVKEIAALEGFCDDIKAAGILSKNISLDPEGMIRYFEGKDTLFRGSRARFAARILPVITAFCALANALVGFNNALIILMGFFVIAQVMVFLTMSNKTEAVLREMSKFKGSLDDFGAMAALISKTPLTAELNVSWQGKLPGAWPLRRISGALNVRNITALDLLLNILLLWDIQCVCRLEDMRDNGAKEMRTWLEAIGYFEAVASVAVLPRLHPGWAYPGIADDFVISAKGLGHPLIDEGERITNDFRLDGVAVISGSNMSGKTTFLRTVGINMVLAYMGAPVCAAHFVAPAVDIRTCMKPPDNLKQSISTFYAELLRIKDIINNDKPQLFLIDEIFAGTNSEDRVEGAKQVLLNLANKKTLGMVTTHDLEVCKTANFANYHFTEHYKDNEIRFDFKIKPGISTTRNARHLMRMIGI